MIMQQIGPVMLDGRASLADKWVAMAITGLFFPTNHAENLLAPALGRQTP